MIRSTRTLLTFGAVVALCAPPAGAYALQATGSGANPVYLHWNADPTFLINDQTADFLPNVTSGSDPAQAIRRSFQTWNEVAPATIGAIDGGTTAITDEGNDGSNVISFVDQGFVFNGALAVTRVFFSGSTGQILGADIVFNPAVTFSTSGSAGSVYDVQEVATHEIGHFFGLAHTGTLAATMYPFGKDDSHIERFLDADDVAGLAANYPGPGLTSDFGTVSGTITRDQVVYFGAHVVCVGTSGSPVISAISLKNGSFEIRGLPPGEYNIFVEPFDGPMTQGNLSGWWSSAAFGAVFPPRFKQSGGSRVVLDVDAGVTLAGTDINVTSNVPAMNPTFIGKQPAGGGGFSVSTTLTTVLQGENDVWNVVLAGSGMSSPATFVILGDGVTRTSGYSYGSFGGGTPYVLATFSFDGSAPPGPRVIRTARDGQVAFLTGGLEILPFPSVLYVDRDPLDPSAVLLEWYGGTPPFDLRRDTSRDFTGSSTLVNETDLIEADPVLLDGVDYYYRIDE